MSNFGRFLLAVVLLGYAPVVGAQEGPPPGGPTAAAADPHAAAKKWEENTKTNAVALRAWSWTMRTEVTASGEVQPAKLYLVRFDIDGKPQRTMTTAAAPAPEPSGLGSRLPNGGIRGRVQDSREEAVKEWAESVASTVVAYTHPSTGTMLDFFSKAQSTVDGGWLRISGSGFLQAGDSVTYWVHPETLAIQRYDFSTTVEGDAMQGLVEYRAVPDGGPIYPARATVTIPAKSVVAKIENFDFQKQ